MGMMGLLAAMVIQGLSIPFPGAVITLVSGYLMSPSPWEMAAISLAMSLTYSISSCVPYAVGFKLQKKLLGGPFQDKFKKAQQMFCRYGEWSIAAARPSGMGMFMSFAAGMGKVKLWRYLLFTVVGTYPWYLLLLFLGRSCKGNIERALGLVHSYSMYILVGALFSLLIWIFINIYRFRFFR